MKVESGINVVVSQPTNRTESLMQCCKDKNVKQQCQGICTFNLDLDFLMFDSQCFTEFDKLMTCGSDGSDHRHCCHENGVPRECLDWCRGLPAKVSQFLTSQILFCEVLRVAFWR